MNRWQYVRYILRVLIGVELMWVVQKILPSRDNMDLIASMAALAMIDQAGKYKQRGEGYVKEQSRNYPNARDWANQPGSSV